MPEENRVTTQSSSESTNAQQRMRMLDRILLVGLIISCTHRGIVHSPILSDTSVANSRGCSGRRCGCRMPVARAATGFSETILNGAGHWSLAAIVFAFGERRSILD